LAPFDVAPTPPCPDVNGEPVTSQSPESRGSGNKKDGEGDVEMDDAEDKGDKSASSVTRAEAEVARLANIILFPDRYDFYMAPRRAARARREKKDAGERSGASEVKEKESPRKDKNGSGDKVTVVIKQEEGTR